MLLTSGQVSAVLSAGIVLLCTSTLFFAGYVLQQQSIKTLNAALHPEHARTGTFAARIAKVQALQKSLQDLQGTTSAPEENDWSRNAYVQLVRRPDEICNAFMLFASLSKQGSQARRLLMYPKAWGGMSSTELDLMAIASNDHLVELIPMEPWTLEEEVADDAIYPLAYMLALTEFKKLLYLQPQGLLTNSSALDQVFGTKMSHFAMAVGDETHPPAYILRPDKEVYEKATESLPSHTSLHVYTDTSKNAFSSQIVSTIGPLREKFGGLQVQRSDLPAYIQIGPATRIYKGTEDAALRKKLDSSNRRQDVLDEAVMEIYSKEAEALCGQGLMHSEVDSGGDGPIRGVVDQQVISMSDDREGLTSKAEAMEADAGQPMLTMPEGKKLEGSEIENVSVQEPEGQPSGGKFHQAQDESIDVQRMVPGTVISGETVKEKSSERSSSQEQYAGTSMEGVSQAEIYAEGVV